jgi:hypothetical protein
VTKERALSRAINSQLSFYIQSGRDERPKRRRAQRSTTASAGESNGHSLLIAQRPGWRARYPGCGTSTFKQLTKATATLAELIQGDDGQRRDRPSNEGRESKRCWPAIQHDCLVQSLAAVGWRWPRRCSWTGLGVSTLARQAKLSRQKPLLAALSGGESASRYHRHDSRYSQKKSERRRSPEGCEATPRLQVPASE